MVWQRDAAVVRLRIQLPRNGVDAAVVRLRIDCRDQCVRFGAKLSTAGGPPSREKEGQFCSFFAGSLFVVQLCWSLAGPTNPCTKCATDCTEAWFFLESFHKRGHVLHEKSEDMWRHNPRESKRLGADPVPWVNVTSCRKKIRTRFHIFGRKSTWRDLMLLFGSSLQSSYVVNQATRAVWHRNHTVWGL